MKNIKKNLKYLVLPLIFIPAILLAQPSTPPPININIPNPTTAGSDLMSVLTTLLQKVVMPIAAIVSVVFIILAGFSFVTAQGKPAEIQKAKSRLLWALIGAGILLGAAGIAKVVQNTVSGLMTN